jgi:hypothetical protein
LTCARALYVFNRWGATSKSEDCKSSAFGGRCCLPIFNFHSPSLLLFFLANDKENKASVLEKKTKAKSINGSFSDRNGNSLSVRQFIPTGLQSSSACESEYFRIERFFSRAGHKQIIQLTITEISYPASSIELLKKQRCQEPLQLNRTGHQVQSHMPGKERVRVFLPLVRRVKLACVCFLNFFLLFTHL